MFHHEMVNHNLLLPCGIGSTPEQAARHRRAPSISVDQATSAHLTGSWTKLCGQSGSPGGLNPVMRWPPPLSHFTKTDSAKALDVRWLFVDICVRNELSLSQEIFTDLRLFINIDGHITGFLNCNIAFLEHSAHVKDETCLHPQNRVLLAVDISSQRRKVSLVFSQVLLCVTGRWQKVLGLKNKTEILQTSERRLDVRGRCQISCLVDLTYSPAPEWRKICVNIDDFF